MLNTPPPPPEGGVASGDAPSAPYNMALVGDPEKKIIGRYGHSRHNRSLNPPHPLVGVDLDKLRLWGLTDVKLEDASEHVYGCQASRIVNGRRRGAFQPRTFKAWTESPGVEGGIYVQLQDVRTHSRELVVEFNPAKMSDVQYKSLLYTLQAFGITDLGSMVVERYDVAFDYQCDRSLLLLDDRVRLMDLFGCGRKGPETERTGFRRGSREKHQLYDKTAERRSKGCDARENITRYEVTIIKPTYSPPESPLFERRAVRERGGGGFLERSSRGTTDTLTHGSPLE